MALINCIECGKEISDQAVACPSCGAPVSSKDEIRSQSPGSALGLVALGLGLGAIFVPYFAAVFFAPAAVICGLIAYRRGQTSFGVAGVLLGLAGLFYIVYVSQQITSLTSGFGRSPLSQTLLDPPPVATMAEYERIREGMDYEKVCIIIGAKGQELSRSDIAGFTTVMYSWTNGNGSNMNVMLQNDSVINKAQFGLR